MAKNWMSFLLGAMTLTATAAFAAEAPSAMLYATGNVSVNGSAVIRSEAVFNGDVIQTKSDSAVTVANNGSSILVPGNSSVVFGNGSVSISSGSAAIKTTQGMSAHVGGMTITPAGNAARYRVAQSGNTVQVASLEGRVSITNGAKNFSLDAGKSMELPLMARNQDPQQPATETTPASTQCSDEDQKAGKCEKCSDDDKKAGKCDKCSDEDRKNRKCGAGAVVTGSGAGAGAGAGVSNSAGIVAGLGAVLAAAIASAVAVTSSNASPTAP